MKARRDERRQGVTSGATRGTSGGFWGLNGEDRRTLIIGWLIAAAAVAATTTINIFTAHHDTPELGLLRPTILEYTSAVANCIAMLAAWAAVRWISLKPRPLWGSALAHTAGLIAYSAIHVGVFVLLRTVAYGLIGEDYVFGLSADEALYEFRKDAIGYAILAGIFWGVHRLRAQPTAQTADRPTTFDIRDGARLLRVEVADILAVTAAGNYAQFILADGRRPLMRSSLAALEQKLGALGFIRTHRSWLVNAARVTALRPDGSGDHTVELGALEAPLSRRFPDALARLRRPNPPAVP